MTRPSANHNQYSGTSRIALWWFPVGAGAPTRLSTTSSSWWERIDAWRSGREPQRLVHSALEIHFGNERYVIEMAPEWSDPHLVDRRVVASGPVGLPVLGRSRFFRYEVRCRPDNRPFDRAMAIDDPVLMPGGSNLANYMLRRIRDVPVLTWGRKVASADDMWNSNSVISWLLVESGVDVSVLASPAGTRAPGWAAGIAEAHLNS